MYETHIPSVLIDFGKDDVHLIQPKSVRFPAKYSNGTAERRMFTILLCWTSTVHKMLGFKHKERASSVEFLSLLPLH
ncbi:unnamed protein product [Euphydryas editha]|uniref:Uncharacterized protein n=1 Tax=Euphydryas editha TaxID=104508 RepID=A0AAU9UF48_EUPED|nr:unnamed protein product [Euphydryas editha]